MFWKHWKVVWEHAYLLKSSHPPLTVFFAEIHFFLLEINEGERERSMNRGTHSTWSTYACLFWFPWTRAPQNHSSLHCKYLTFFFTFGVELDSFLLIKETLESFCPLSTEWSLTVSNIIPVHWGLTWVLRSNVAVVRMPLVLVPWLSSVRAKHPKI